MQLAPIKVKPSLQVLANRTGTDKHWLHGYMDEYARHFNPIRSQPIKLLEIGIGGYGVKDRGGESLTMWAAYFSEGKINGLDIEDKSFLDSDRITTFVADQSKPEDLTKINDAAGPFDLIIDDGSHIQNHILTSFFTLFPLLDHGGIYVIEDLETAYREDHGGSNDQSSGTTSISMIQRLIDGMHWQFWRGRGPTKIDEMVKSVHVSKELCFIYKTDKA